MDQNTSTPSSRTHSAASPFFNGLDCSEVSPAPSTNIESQCWNSIQVHRETFTRILRIVVPATDDIFDLVRLAYIAHGMHER